MGMARFARMTEQGGLQTRPYEEKCYESAN